MEKNRELEIESQVKSGLEDLQRRIKQPGITRVSVGQINRTVTLRKYSEDGTWEEFSVDFLLARIGRLRRRVFAWSQCFRDVPVKFIMVGLTYRNQDLFKLRDITDFIRRLRRRRLVYGYCWVHEMQNRRDGTKVSHYHVIVAVKPGTRLPMPDKSGYWKKGSSSVTWARSPYYICSYTGKEDQKKGLPVYAHMYAAWISPEIYKTLSKYLKSEFKKSTYPCWLNQVLNTRLDWVTEGVPVERVRSGGGGGWWVDNMLFESPYEVKF